MPEKLAKYWIVVGVREVFNSLEEGEIETYYFIEDKPYWSKDSNRAVRFTKRQLAIEAVERYKQLGVMLQVVQVFKLADCRLLENS